MLVLLLLSAPPADAAWLYDQIPAPRVAGYSVLGSPIVYHVVGDGPDTTLILATIHGDEDAGTPLVIGLLEHLGRHRHILQGRRAVVVPIANPDGHRRRRRTNANGVDLNRNFPGPTWRARSWHGEEPLSEPESQAIQGLIDRYHPDRVVSLHQPLKAMDFDGPAFHLAQAMADQCPLSVRKLGARAGSLGAWAGEHLGIPTVTFELPWAAHLYRDEYLWSSYGPALLAALTHRAAPGLDDVVAPH